MKKMAKVAMLTLAGLIAFAFTNNKPSATFEGVVIYNVKVDCDNPQVGQMLQGMTTKTYIKGDMSRTETNTGMSNHIFITNRKKPGEVIELVESAGNKYQVKKDDKTNESDDLVSEIKYLDSTKNIAGYSCKAAQATLTDKKTQEKFTTVVYYTDQLPYSTQGKFKDLKGFPLSYCMKKMEMGVTIAMTFTAKSIEKQSVSDNLFIVPSGYKLMTMEEIRKDAMSHMGGGGN